MRTGRETFANPAHAFPEGGMYLPVFPQGLDQLVRIVDESAAARRWQDDHLRPSVVFPARCAAKATGIRPSCCWCGGARQEMSPPFASLLRGPPAASASRGPGQLVLPLPLYGRHEARPLETICLRSPPP